MADKLEERLDKYLDFLEKSLVDGTEFVKEQAPDVVEQYLAWEFWSSLGYAGITLCVMVLMVYIIKVCNDDYNEEKKKPSPSEEALNLNGGLCAVTLALLVFLVFPIFIVNVKNAIKVKIAPKIVVLEELHKLSK